MSPSRRTGGSVRRKATLFCPACGHESPVDGDWEVHTTEELIATDCPACGTRIDECPRRWPQAVDATARWDVGAATSTGTDVDALPETIVEAAGLPARLVLALQWVWYDWWSAEVERYARVPPTV